MPSTAVLAVLLTLAITVFPVSAKVFHKTIHFERGASSAAVQGAVVRGDRDIYMLSASAGQEMVVNVDSRENNAAIVIHAPGNRMLPGAADGDDASNWRGRLPVSGAYRIEVGPTRGNSEYTLTVSIR